VTRAPTDESMSSVGEDCRISSSNGSIRTKTWCVRNSLGRMVLMLRMIRLPLIWFGPGSRTVVNDRIR
jgi:hypothetical protein